MKKILLSVLLLLCAVVALQAQKLKGNFSGLAGQENINVVFVYDGVTYDGDSEAAFFKDNSDRDDFAEWKSNWAGSFRTDWATAFVAECNQELAKKSLKVGDFPTADYTATVKLTDIDPGSFAGPFSQPCKLTGVITFAKTGDNTSFATIEFKKLPGNSYQMTPLVEQRVKFAFNQLGEALGKILDKKVK